MYCFVPPWSDSPSRRQHSDLCSYTGTNRHVSSSDYHSRTGLCCVGWRLGRDGSTCLGYHINILAGLTCTTHVRIQCLPWPSTMKTTSLATCVEMWQYTSSQLAPERLACGCMSTIVLPVPNSSIPRRVFRDLNTAHAKGTNAWPRLSHVCLLEHKIKMLLVQAVAVAWFPHDTPDEKRPGECSLHKFIQPCFPLNYLNSMRPA